MQKDWEWALGSPLSNITGPEQPWSPDTSTQHGAVPCTHHLITAGTCSCLPPPYTCVSTTPPSSSLESPPSSGFQMLFHAWQSQ